MARYRRTITAPIFNSRNPFALTRGNFESNQVNGNIGGGLGKHASLFFNADYRNIANSSVINAQILGPAPTFTPQAYQALFPLPQYRLNIGPRFDWQVSNNNTLTVRYQYERNSVTNSGVGNLILPVQASNALQTEDQLQMTDTQYLGKRVVYETHFQYLHEPTSNLAANLIPVDQCSRRVHRRRKRKRAVTSRIAMNCKATLRSRS